MLKRFSLLFVALPLLAAAPAVGAGDAETFSAAQDFIAALTSLDAALHRLHDLIIADKVNPSDVEQICAALNPNPNEPPDTPISLSELLKNNNLSSGDARILCDASNAARTIGEQAKTANLRAATECKAFRIPACDIANEVVAAERDSRARMGAGGAK